jgi:hypothetical protein
MFTAFGIMSLMLAVILLSGKQPTTFKGEQGQILGVYDLTTAFRIAAAGALLVACGLFTAAWRSWRKRGVEQHQDPYATQNSTEEDWLQRPSRLWLILNGALIGAGFWMGREEIAGLQRNSPAALCVSIILGSCIFAVSTVAVSRATIFKRPTWNRFPLSWGSDPLQCLFISTCCTLAALAGSVLRFETFTPGRFWTAGVFCSLLAGLILGQVVVYLIYRSRIEVSTRKRPS